MKILPISIPLLILAQAAPAAGADDFAALLHSMGSNDRRVRYAAAAEAWQTVALEHLDHLHSVLHESPSARVRPGATTLLGKLCQPTSVPYLIQALRDDNAYRTRRGAAQALGRIGSTEAVSALTTALTGDAEPSVRKLAAVAIGRIGGAPAGSILRKAYRTQSDPDVRTVIRETQHRMRAPQERPARCTLGQVSEGYLKGTRYLLYAPASYRPSSPPPLLVSVHGTHGEPDGYLEMCRQDADRLGLVIIAPHFDHATFTDFGNLDPWIGCTRSDLRLLEIIDDVAARLPVQSDRFYLFGHSQGGQFAHRFVLAHPQRILRAVACASGNYVHPYKDVPFPVGIADNPSAADLADLDFRAMIQTPLAIVIGTNDLQRRRDEATRFMQEVAVFTAEHNLVSRIEYLEVLNGPHRGTSNYPTASRFLFRELDE